MFIYKQPKNIRLPKYFLLVFGMVLLFSPQMAIPQIPASGLVANYPFNGNTNDVSGNSNNGSITGGVALTTDRFGRTDSAYVFDGTGEITIPDATSLRPANAISVVAWVFLTDTATWPNVVCKSHSLSDPFHSYILGTDNWSTNTQWAFAVSNGGAGSLGYTDEPSGVGMNQWIFLVGTYDGAYVKIYMNGLLVKKEPKTGAIGYTASPLRIGSAGSGANFTGKIDDVLIYDRALSDCEISQIYNIDQPTVLTVTSIVTGVTCFGGNDGAIDLTPSGGIENGCLSFDGVNDIVNIGATDRASDSFTMEAWFKPWGPHEVDPESVSGFDGTLGQKYLFGPVNGIANATAGVSVGTNGISVYEHGTGYMPAVAVYAASITNDWNHVAVVYDNKTPLIYLNGILVHTGLVGTKPSVLSPLAIGGEYYGHHAGLIDEARIWDKAFTAAEVLNSYNSCSITPSDVNYPFLIGYWNMNEGAGPVMNDISGTANNGVLNGPLWQGQDSVTYGCNNNTIYNFQWSTSDTTEDISNLVADIYSVTITDGNACTYNDSIEVLEPSLVAANAGSDTSICSDTSVTLSASGGISYAWSPGTGLSDSAIFNPVAAPTVSTSYVVTVTDSAACSNTDTIMVTVFNIPNPIISSIDSLNFCEGDSALLVASSAFSYLWSSGDTTQSITIDTSGSYTVTVADTNGCTATTAATDVVVFSNPTPAISASGPVTFCQGDSVTLSSSASDAYIWSSGDTSQNLVIDTSGTYTVSVTDSNGCSGTSTPITVTVNPNPASVITASGPSVFCDGDSVILTSSIADSYLWSTGDTTSSIIVSSSNSFTVTVTDSNGCNTTSATTVVTSNPNALIDSVTAIDESGCSFGDGAITIIASSGTAPLLYSINGGGSYVVGNVFTNLNSGTYMVSVTDSNSCDVTGPVIIISAPGMPPAPILSNDTSYCEGEALSNLSATAGSGGTITWYDNLGNSLGAGSSFTPFSSVGTTFYYATETLAGCESPADSVALTIIPLPAVPSINADTSYCQGDMILDLNAFPVSGGSIIWYADAALTNVASVGISLAPDTNLGTMVYYATETVGGCESLADSAIITISSIPVAPIVSTGITYCEGASISDLSATGTNIEWFTDTGLTNSIGAGSMLAISPVLGDNVYYITQMINGCQSPPAICYCPEQRYLYRARPKRLAQCIRC